MSGYTLADLIRNPRRTLSTVVGVALGVGLFCGVLFFVDGLSASMTQRAVAPLAIDMQRIVSERAGTNLRVSQSFSVSGAGETEVTISITHTGATAAHEVTIRSLPTEGLTYVPGSAQLDGVPIPDNDGNPFAQGPARTGYNLGTIDPGSSLTLAYAVAASDGVEADDTTVLTSFSSRESVTPITANQPAFVALDELASQIADLPGVEAAVPLSMADLGTAAIHSGDRTATGQAKIFGFDSAYADHDETITIVSGDLQADGAVVSAEAGRTLGIGVGDVVSIDLPDGTTIDLAVTGIADLSRSRSLFSSRRGGDLETFIYTPNSVVVTPRTFAETVFPAFERAIAAETGRLKSPPIREVDISVDRELLDADPASAVAETEHIATQVMAIASHQDYLLDNITNTLNVAADDARTAKRLFVFLGVPGALLAAILAAYAGNVMAEAQRREQATLRIRGADRALLLRMLALRTAMITAIGALLGLVAGYAAALAIVGRDALARAGAANLALSALIGTIAGYLATGAALYVTGRRSIDREINEDRARLAVRLPYWRRTRLDMAGSAVVVAGTAWALTTGAFDGAPGSVYYGRAVQLNLALLALPVAAWITGSLFAGRVFGNALDRSRPDSVQQFGRVGPALLRRSIGRRPWSIGNAAIVASLIVAMVTCLAAFTASYRAAKIEDARYANGADIRITPSPTAEHTYRADDVSAFQSPDIEQVTPVIFGLSNVILRSARTSDPANLVALDPPTFAQVAPVQSDMVGELTDLGADSGGILLSSDMATFLRVQPGDTLDVLLARATPDQTELAFTLTGTFERLPGFPSGADAVIDIATHTAAIPAKVPDFFLASVKRNDDRGLEAAVAGLRAGPATADHLQIDTRLSTLDRDQSSLAALNIAGLVSLDSVFALAMTIVTIVIFVFGLLLQRRREYVALRAMGLNPRTIRSLIASEAGAAAFGGTTAGLLIGAVMGFYFVSVLRPLFVLDPAYRIPLGSIALPVVLMTVATGASAIAASRLVSSLDPTELLRDD